MRMRQKRMNRRQSKRSGSKPTNGIKNRNVVFSETNSEKEVDRIFSPKLNMIGNMLLTEAIYRSFFMFEKPALLVTFDARFCKKVWSVYTPSGPKLDYEVARDANSFIDLQKILLEFKCKIVQTS